MKKYLVISQILYVLFALPWFFTWGMSVMMFDNGWSVQGIIIFLVIGAYPVAVIVCTILAWVLRVRRKRTAIIVNLIPMLWVVGIGLPLLMINVF